MAGDYLGAKKKVFSDIMDYADRGNADELKSRYGKAPPPPMDASSDPADPPPPADDGLDAPSMDELPPVDATDEEGLADPTAGDVEMGGGSTRPASSGDVDEELTDVDLNDPGLMKILDPEGLAEAADDGD